MDWMWMWFGLALVLFLVELCTVDLLSVWFAIAALLLGIVTALAPTLHIVWQLVIFMVLSASLFIATRPFVKRFSARRKGQETNLELIVGATARVTERIENDRELGSVKLNGLMWTARSVDGSIIEIDELVEIKEIKGNKVFVEKTNSK
jgi:membrane protein implicated in regulation of membrane protease activity